MALITAASALLPYASPFARSNGCEREESPNSTSRTTKAAPRRLSNYKVVTCNCNAASSLNAFLRDTEAAVVAAQELHTLSDDNSDLATWAARNHSRPHIESALPGVGLGSTGGIGIFVREGTASSVHLGAPVPGRAIAVEFDFGASSPRRRLLRLPCHGRSPLRS